MTVHEDRPRPKTQRELIVELHEMVTKVIRGEIIIMAVQQDISDEVDAILAAVAQVQADFETVINQQEPDVKASFQPVLDSLAKLDAAVEAAGTPTTTTTPAPTP